MKKSKILELLRECRHEYVSGEAISNLLGVSRTAIWKQIKALRNHGYEIESSPRNGYRLMEEPDILDPQVIKAGLPRTSRMGNSIIKIDEVDSTNEFAKSLAENDCAEGTVVLAEKQSKGKGRLGRDWNSPAGKGIWMSVVLRPPLSPIESPQIPLVCAVAVAHSLKTTFDITAGIKWPNDLLLGDRKVCGILMEIRAEADCVHHAVVGIGVNVNQREQDFPADVRGKAISLRMHLGHKIHRNELVINMLQALESYYRALIDTGFEAIKEEWQKYNVILGKHITITQISGSNPLHGVAKGITDDGSLLVLLEDGQERRFYAGDVTLKDGGDR